MRVECSSHSFSVTHICNIDDQWDSGGVGPRGTPRRGAEAELSEPKESK